MSIVEGIKRLSKTSKKTSISRGTARGVSCFEEYCKEYSRRIARSIVDNRKSNNVPKFLSSDFRRLVARA
jgi:hypothetical protein